MSKKKILPGVLLSGLSLGTSWAVRGSFGHEHGAAWAGSIGALSVILLSKNPSWYAGFFKATLAAAVGWGIGGIMSYGLVVGYGNGSDFGNVYYGLSMLFLIGGLYGFIGGGLFGLALADSVPSKVKWHLLMVEMIAGGLMFYYFIIISFEWLITPPRSEEWAVCLGMAFALLWFLYRNGQHAAIRVAVFSAIGAGFGFAFGNFLQVMGRSGSLSFINLWNVMEYSIGFFGGCGMAYGTFTSKWEGTASDIEKESATEKGTGVRFVTATETGIVMEITAAKEAAARFEALKEIAAGTQAETATRLMTETRYRKPAVLLPLVIIALIIPFIVWDQTETMEKLVERAKSIPAARFIQLSSLGLAMILGLFWIKKYYLDLRSTTRPYDFRLVYVFFIGHFLLYTIFHLLNSAAFINGISLEQTLYLLNLACIFFFIPKIAPCFLPAGLNTGKWAALLFVLLGVIAALAFIAINAHGELPGVQKRFK